jgi:NAD-dependent deacetylase
MRAELKSLLSGAKRILVFTGAGISTNSGIPDFRGPNGLWQRRQPIYFHEFLRSADKRREYWQYRLEAYPLIANAKPNAAHFAVADLERRGRVQAVVTQNIDGLHQAAGSSAERVIEVHGTALKVACIACGADSDGDAAMRAFADTGVVPTCACGGWLKSATISFGQSLDPVVLSRAFAEAQRADLVLALGSTLSVHPAADIPLTAKRRGVPYVIINRGETDHDQLATLRLDGDVSEILPAVVDQLPAA